MKPMCLIVYGSRYLGVDVFANECRHFKLDHGRTKFRNQYSAENDPKRQKTKQPKRLALTDYCLFWKVDT